MCFHRAAGIEPIEHPLTQSRAYLAENGTPDTPEDLRRHRWIRQRLPSGKLYRWEFARNAEESTIDAPGALTLDHNGLMVEAAEGGLGIAFVPEPFARQALEEDRLVRVLAEWSPAIPSLCLYYFGHRHPPPALHAFIEESAPMDGDADATQLGVCERIPQQGSVCA